jgi:hypothetical protein
MKTLMAAVALPTVFAAPAFAQSVSAWGWKGALAAPASATSAYAAASFNGRRSALSNRRGALRDLAYAPTKPSWRSSTCWMPCNCNVTPGTGPTATELRSATQRGRLHGRDADVLRASPNWQSCFVKRTSMGFDCAARNARTPIRDSVEGNSFSPQLELDSG